MDEPIAEQAGEQEPAPGPARDLLLEIELDATLQFGSREMPLKEVLAFGPGDVLELDRQVGIAGGSGGWRQDHGARRGGDCQWQLCPVGDRSGGTADAAGEKTSPF